MKMIGFVGPKQSGKDTAADLLKKSGKARGKISFAGPLKELCSRVFNVPLRYFNDPELKEKPFEEFEKIGETPKLTPAILKQIKKECTKFLSEYDDDGNIISTEHLLLGLRIDL